MNSGSTNSPWLSRYAFLTALATLGLICAGGLVTSHEAGMAVPDWPTSSGYNMFFFPISRWVGGVFYEHTHRLIASAVGFMTIILAAWLWMAEERRWLRWLGVIALATVSVQGVLGGLRVTKAMDELGIFHATLAQMYFVLVAAIALFTSKTWEKTEELPMPAKALGTTYVTISVLILLQLVIAATMRHQHAGLAIPDFPLAYGNLWPATDPAAIASYNQMRTEITSYKAITAFQVWLQMAHRIVAFVILGTVALAAWKTKVKLGRRSQLGKMSLLLLGLVVMQVLLGAATIWTNKSADIATAHVAVGALSFMVSVLMVIIGARGVAVSLARLTEKRTGFDAPSAVTPI